MAGIYDRLQPGGLDGDGGDRINNHLFCYAISAYVGAVWSKAQIIAAVNQDLANSGSQPLRTDDLQDVDDIVDQIDLKSTNTQKILYGISNLEPSCYAAERDLVNETQWRSALGI